LFSRNPQINLKLFNFVLIILLITGGTAVRSQDSLVQSMFGLNRNQLVIPDIEDVYGAAFHDINGDDLPDLYLICYRGFNRLLLNSGGGVYFYDATIISGLGGNLMPMGEYNLELGTVAADFDNDGDADVIISGWGQTTRYYRNEGGLVFKESSNLLDIPNHLYINGVFTADVNLDGFLDVFFTDERLTNRLLLNDGSGGFKDITRGAGLVKTGTSRGAAFVDVDLDGDPDLYVANQAGPDQFYRNESGNFISMNLPIAALHDTVSSSSVSFGDLDNDGDFDLYITRPFAPDLLYFNETPVGDTLWVFHKVESNRSPAGSKQAVGSILGDFNQDGYVDIFQVNNGPNQLFLNEKGTSFRQVWKGELPGDRSTGAAAADFDGDGDLDIFTANLNSFSLFHVNPLDNDQNIRFKIEGVYSNRDGLGTRVSIYKAGSHYASTELLASRESQGNSCLFSNSEPVIHFGLDSLRLVDARVHFTSGRIIDLPHLQPGRVYVVTETSDFKRSLVRLGRMIRNTIRHEKFWTGLVLILIFPLLLTVIIRLGLKRYFWSARTSTIVPAVFFVTAYLVSILFKNEGFIYIFFVIDIVTLIFGMGQSLHFERLLRLRRIRERYRSVLIDLSRRIVEIRDAKTLLETSAEHISQNTEFKNTAAALYSSKNKKFNLLYCPADFTSIEELNAVENINFFTTDISSQEVLSGRDLPEFLRNAVHSLHPLKRGKRFYGCLFLAADRSVSRLSEDDTELFHSITNQMAVAAENIEYIKQSNEMIKRLTEAEVKEKYLYELESKNLTLDEKNRELQRLYDELKQTETQLIHSEKMASLGQLVAGIAHELNNPIGFIYGNVMQLDNYISKIEKYIASFKDESGPVADLLPDLRGLIDDTLRGSRTVKELVENLRTFSHLDQAELKPADIHAGLETCLMILRPELKARISIKKNFEAEGIVDCNIGQINQVFLNILMNAAQAIVNNGEISIHTFNSSKRTIIEIKDSGSGIPAKIMDKIFDPFYTTKDIGKGMGLGLSISYSIVENHGGRIEVESEKNFGSLFRIIL